MAVYSNSHILAAVITKWARPAIEQLLSGRMDGLPWVQGVTNKVRSTGWVSPNWSLGKEIAPLMQGMTEVLVIPMIESYLRGFPDDALPHVAHKFVDTAIANNGLSLFDGNVVFDRDDLVELKHYLEWNLPVGASPEYEVKTSGDNTNTTQTQ